MKAPTLSRAVTIAIGCTAVLLSHSTLADISLREEVSVKGAGVMSFANMSGTSVTLIADDKASMQSDLQMESRLTRMFAGGAGSTAEIVRLDEGKVYQLDMKKRQYSEISLADQRAQLQEALQQAESAQQQQQPVAMDDSQCEWSDPVAEVTRGGKATIAGYETEQLTIATRQACTDRTSGQVCELAISLEQWLAEDFATDAAGFQQAYAEQMGMDAAGTGAMAQQAEMLLGRYQGLWTEIAEQTAGIEGYPLKSRFELAIGGPQCEQGRESAGVTAGDVGEAVGGIGGRIAGSLLKRRRATEPEAPAAAGSAMTPLLTLTSELVQVSLDPVPAETFEVPEGFTRIN